MRIWKGIVALFIVLVSTMSVAKQLPQVIKEVKQSVVGVGTHTQFPRSHSILKGSGFVIGNGEYIVTNDHVLPIILEEDIYQKIAVFVGSGNKPQVKDVEIIARSKKYDLAILKFVDYKLPALKLAGKEYLLEGNEIAFTGFPLGAFLGLYPVTHKGIISAITPAAIPVDQAGKISIKMLKMLRDPYLVYQLDAVAYPGNSGSALYKADTGEVVGVINKVFVQETKESAITKPSGITYAIPIQYVRELAHQHDIEL